MSNLLLKDYKTRAVYALYWVLITIVQIWVVYNFAPNHAYAALDAIVFNILFALLVLILWYPLYYNRKKNAPWYNIVFSQLSVAIAFLALWQIVGYVTMSILTADDEVYRKFYFSSLPWRLVYGVLSYMVAVLCCSLLVFIDELKEKAKNEIRLNEIIRDSELRLLKSQINPHFLFNSLNSVNSLILQNAERAREMVVALSDFLRYTVLSTNQNMMTVEQEVENVKRYLSIEHLRFGDKLAYTFDVQPEALTVKMPSMMLQPIFENAIKHGVCESLQTVQVWTKVDRRDDYILIEIGNDFEPGASSKKGSGTGLRNISERLRLLYGTNASMQVRKENERFTVVLQIPTSP